MHEADCEKTDKTCKANETREGEGRIEGKGRHLSMQNRLTTTLIEFATKKTEKETRGREREKHRKRDSERKVKGKAESGEKTMQ